MPINHQKLSERLQAYYYGREHSCSTFGKEYIFLHHTIIASRSDFSFQILPHHNITSYLLPLLIFHFWEPRSRSCSGLSRIQFLHLDCLFSFAEGFLNGLCWVENGLKEYLTLWWVPDFSLVDAIFLDLSSESVLWDPDSSIQGLRCSHSFL